MIYSSLLSLGFIITFPRRISLAAFSCPFPRYLLFEERCNKVCLCVLCCVLCAVCVCVCCVWCVCSFVGVQVSSPLVVLVVREHVDPANRANAIRLEPSLDARLVEPVLARESH